jgi:HAE1 family hydrophobic/amphiphilic exporter-1
MSGVLRERLRAGAGHHRHARGPAGPGGRQKQVEFSLQGPDLQELERLTRLVTEKIRDIPGLVDLDSSASPTSP